MYIWDNRILLNYNVILYWLQSQTDFSFWVDHTNDIRYGYGRYNSLFHFPITFGDACVVFFISLFSFVVNVERRL